MLPIVIVVALVIAAFWLWSLIDVLSWPASTWEAAGLSKGRWVVRVLLLGSLGSALYLASPRRELRAAYAAIRWDR